MDEASQGYAERSTQLSDLQKAHSKLQVDSESMRLRMTEELQQAQRRADRVQESLQSVSADLQARTSKVAELEALLQRNQDELNGFIQSNQIKSEEVSSLLSRRSSEAEQLKGTLTETTAKYEATVANLRCVPMLYCYVITSPQLLTRHRSPA